MANESITLSLSLSLKLNSFHISYQVIGLACAEDTASDGRTNNRNGVAEKAEMCFSLKKMIRHHLLFFQYLEDTKKTMHLFPTVCNRKADLLHFLERFEMTK